MDAYAAEFKFFKKLFFFSREMKRCRTDVAFGSSPYRCGSVSEFLQEKRRPEIGSRFCLLHQLHLWAIHDARVGFLPASLLL